MRFSQVIFDMITSPNGAVSSKRVIGAISYLLTTFAIVVLMFVNPGFTGLSEIIIFNLVTSTGLLGLTTVENIKRKLDQKEEDNSNNDNT